jgi:tetratricopeptide (TPR) repeat protein
MKPIAILRRLARRFALRMALAVWALVALQAAPPQRNSLAAYGQSASKSSGQTRTQKLANPLNDLLDEAQHDIDSNHFEAAIAPLQKFLAEQPNVAFAHFQLAYAYTALKRTDEAKAEYQRALEIDPKMSEAALNLGILLLPSDPAGAAAALRKAVELLPSQSRPRYLLGVALERTGDLPSAAEAFEGASRLDPRDAEPLVHLGEIYLKLNRPADAAAKFRAALEIEKNNPAALLGLAKSLDAQKLPEAEAAYRDYLAAQPGDSAGRARLVHLLVERQEYDAAIAELDRADAGKAPTADSLRLRADIEIGQKKWDDAIGTIQRAIALAPGDAELHGGLGRVYLQKRDFPSAEKELKTAIQMDHNNIVYWKDLSSTYYLGGNFSSALAALDVVAKAETPGAGAWFIRALCYDKLNQFQPALDAYQKFLDLDKGQNPDQVWQAQQRSKVLRRKLEEKR